MVGNRSVLPPVAAFNPFLAGQEADTCGWTKYRGAAKTKAEP